MKKTVLLFLLSFTLHAFANPALHGTWSAAVEGQSLVVVFEAGGRGLRPLLQSLCACIFKSGRP